MKKITFIAALLLLTSAVSSFSGDDEVTTQSLDETRARDASSFNVDPRSDPESTDHLPVGSFMVRTSPLASAASTLMFVSFKNFSSPGRFINLL